MQLIIVESPTKARTLSKFLGSDYSIEATMGHVRDLPKSKFGIDVEHNFSPEYVTLADKKKSIDSIETASRKASKIYLATDPDREGEAIAWHIAALLAGNLKLRRIVFHEITQEAVQNAIRHPREVDMHLVDAQQARRVLDRVVGYKLSPLLWKKVRRGLSAGRVQSVAVRIIVEREREIEKFQKENYWRIFGVFRPPAQRASGPAGDIFIAELVSHNDKPFQKSETFKLFVGTHTVTQTNIKNEKQAEDLILDFGEKFFIEAVEEKESLRRPSAPFTTSTLQQAAYRKLRLTSSRTMVLAQKLYENGLITYHRTDSTHLATAAVTRIRDYIGKSFGEKYLPKSFNVYQVKSKVAQEAHEAIRPTDVARSSAPGEGAKLYDLIWKQAVASQMSPAILEETKYEIRDTKGGPASPDDRASRGGYEFEAKGERVIFDGYWKVVGIPRDENILPKLAKNDEVVPDVFDTVESSTSPPPRYTDASLIGALEREEIGRPSTYAPIILTIQIRQYIEKEEGRFTPTPVGVAVNDFLVENFPDVLDLPFTAKMEEDLDQIANGKVKWVPVIKDFWTDFSKKLESVGEKAKRVKIEVEKTGDGCPKCKKGEQVIRVGRFGKFLSCSTFPDCDWTEQLVEKLNIKCPKCSKGEVIIRKTKRQRQFYGCSRYPQCHFASWRKPSQTPS